MKNQTPDCSVDTSSKQRSKWIKVPKTASLYRWGKAGNYYIRATVNGRAISESLETTDLALAKRKILEVKQTQKRILTGGGKINLVTLIEQYKIDRNGKNQTTIQDVISRLKKYPEFSNQSIDKIDRLTIGKWFSDLNLNPSFNNQNVETLKAAFEFAIDQKYIVENPIKKKMFRKKVVRIKPDIPTIEQFEAIRKQIKNNKFSDTAKQAWELLSLCGMFGCYEAEARALDWSDINWTSKKIRLVRQKTGYEYKVPIFDHAETFLNDLWEDRKKPTSGKVFEIKTVKRSLETACKKLGYHHFTILNFRQMHVCRLLLAGVSIKNTSKWIGHQDGGVLVMQNYSEVISEMDTTQEENDLKKLKESSK